MRPTIANQQWKVHSQVKTKHFIWIFYLAASGGFAEQLFTIWHDNREERALPPRAPPSTYCAAGTGAHVGQDAVGSCVLLCCLIDLTWSTSTFKVFGCQHWIFQARKGTGKRTLNEKLGRNTFKLRLFTNWSKWPWPSHFTFSALSYKMQESMDCFSY